MSRLEDELRSALRRENPGPDFTARVLARAAAQPAPRPKWWQAFTMPRLRWAMAGALACAIAVAGIEYRHQQIERAQGEQAKRQLVLALRIAGSKLRMAQTKVIELNERN